MSVPFSAITSALSVGERGKAVTQYIATVCVFLWREKRPHAFPLPSLIPVLSCPALLPRWRIRDCKYLQRAL